MSRRDRRAAASQEKLRNRETAGTSVPLVAPIVEKPRKIGLLLRLFSRILLSKWVMRRVSHPQVLATLGEVARQSGRMDVLVEIQARLRGGAK